MMKTFVCRGRVNSVTGTRRTHTHTTVSLLVWNMSGSTRVSRYQIGVNANLELVAKFCYLGNMLSVDRDADAAVETRIRIGWNKFR